jgi:hypothetical protein
MTNNIKVANKAEALKKLAEKKANLYKGVTTCYSSHLKAVPGKITFLSCNGCPNDVICFELNKVINKFFQNSIKAL